MAQPLMQTDRFKYDLTAIEDVLLLVEIGKAFGGRDIGAAGTWDEAAARVAEVAG